MPLAFVLAALLLGAMPLSGRGASPDGGQAPAVDGGSPPADAGTPAPLPVEAPERSSGDAGTPFGSSAPDGGERPMPIWQLGLSSEEPTEPAAATETIVTASREPRPVDQEGRAVNVVSAEELSRRPPHSTPEALRDEEGVFVQRTNTAGGAPIIRGLYGQHVLVLVDGVRLNNATTRAGPNQSLNTVDPFWVEQLEVLRGTGSVLYGSDALGGVVNVLTPTPRFSRDGNATPSAEARLLAGTADQSVQGHLRAGMSLQDVAISAGVTGRKLGDLTGGARVGLQRYTAYGEYDAAVKLRQRLAPGAQLLVQYQAVRQADAPRTDLSVPGNFRLFSAQERDLAHARADFSAVGPFRVQADLSVHRQAERAERFRVEADRLSRDTATVWTYGGRLEASALPELPWLGRANVTLGADAYLDRALSRFQAGNISSFGAFSDEPEQARYVSPSYQLAAGAFGYFSTDPRPLGLRGGVRAQLNETTLPEDDRLARLFPGGEVFAASQVRTPGVAAELGVNAEWFDGFIVLVNASTGFRAPNVDDYLRLGPEGAGFLVPTRDLGAEQSYSGELGLRYHRGPLALQLFYAYTTVRGLVAAVPVVVNAAAVSPDGLPYLQRVNADAANIHALDASLSVRLPSSLLMSAGALWLKGDQIREDPATDRTVTEPMSKMPPPSGVVRLTYEPRDGLFAEAVLRWALAQTRLSAADREDVRICSEAPECTGTPGFLTLHLRGGWRVTDQFALTLAVQNLANESYRYHASGVDEAGLSVVLGLEGSL